MSLDELTDLHGPDPIGAAEQLAALLDLASVDIQVRGARTFGQGSRASVQIDLSNGETLEFDSLRDMVRPQNLIAEVVACSGATPALKQPQAVRAVALVRAIAEHTRTMTADDIAVDWGITYLQRTDVLDVDLNEQRARWGAFSHIKPLDGGIVLRHTDGRRLVRAGWFRSFVKAEHDHLVSPKEIHQRMERVGWHLPGGGGRVKATCPGRRESLVWTFYSVLSDWEQRWDG